MSVSGFTAQNLVQINIPSPSGQVKLYGIFAHPVTGYLVEKGELIIYETAGILGNRVSKQAYPAGNWMLFFITTMQNL